MGNYFFLKIIYFKPFNEIIQFFTSSKIQFNSFVIVTYIRMIALDAQILSLGRGGSEQPQFPMYMLLKLYIYVFFKWKAILTISFVYQKTKIRILIIYFFYAFLKVVSILMTDMGKEGLIYNSV